MLVLNGGLAPAAIGAVELLGSETLVGSIGRPPSWWELVSSGQVLFSICDEGFLQAGSLASALKSFDASETERVRVLLTAGPKSGTPLILIRPHVFDLDAIKSLPAGWRQQICALADRIVPDREWRFCARP